jgi:hypothetical protein
MCLSITQEITMKNLIHRIRLAMSPSYAAFVRWEDWEQYRREVMHASKLRHAKLFLQRCEIERARTYPFAY